MESKYLIIGLLFLTVIGCTNKNDFYQKEDCAKFIPQASIRYAPGNSQNAIFQGTFFSKKLNSCISLYSNSRASEIINELTGETLYEVKSIDQLKTSLKIVE